MCTVSRKRAQVDITMSAKIEGYDDDDDDVEDRKRKKLHPMAFSVFIIPIGCVLTYMLMDHELAVSGYILSICAGIAGMILYFTLFLDNSDEIRDKIADEYVSVCLNH